MLKKLFSIGLSLLSILTAHYTLARTEVFLPPDKAFEISALLSSEQLQITFRAAPGYYMYEESMQLRQKDSDKTITPTTKPKPHEKFDNNFQKIVKTYDGEVAFIYDTKLLPDTSPLILDVNVQGCANQGICYPPMLRRITLQEYGKTVNSTDPEIVIPELEVNNKLSWWEVSDDLNALNRLLTTTSLPVLLVLFFLLGIGLAFTPCMLPMLPILSSVVFGTIDHHLLPRKKTIILALFYILGMACAFSLAGMATAWFGAGITAGLQNRWVLLAFGGLMLILSAALLGFYELQMPHTWQSKVDKWIGKHEGGNIYGVFALGALSSLVASPCVSAPLAGVLTFIAQSGQVQLGGLILFVMACGMGVPLFLFALGASRIVPRAGKWMLRVQRFFGFMMVLLALWVMLPALQSFFKESKVVNQSKTINQQLYEVVTNNVELEQKLTQAKENKQKAIVIISADWCVSCKELELQTLANEQVQTKLKEYKRIEVDITEMGPDQKSLLSQYKIFGPPAILFFDSSGIEQKSKKSVGVVSSQKLLLLL
jgi:thiol:disulfide interchange protein DsbD